MRFCIISVISTPERSSSMSALTPSTLPALFLREQGTLLPSVETTSQIRILSSAYTLEHHLMRCGRNISMAPLQWLHRLSFPRGGEVRGAAKPDYAAPQ